MSVFDEVPGKIKEQVAFLFKDAGDSVFHIEGTGLAAMNVDVVEDETHTWANDVSNYPTEGAGEISDNIRSKPNELKVRCFVSNTPISGLIDEVTHFADRFLNGRKRTQEAYNMLKDLHRLRVPVTIATRYEQHLDMAITSIQIVRQPENGESIVFDIAFKAINIVKQQTGNVPPGLGGAGKQSDNATQKRAGSKVDAGKGNGKEVKVDPKEAKKGGSFANALANQAEKLGISRNVTAGVLGAMVGGVPGAAAASGSVRP